MKILKLSLMTNKERKLIMGRNRKKEADLFKRAQKIITDVEANGDKAVFKYGKLFDGQKDNNFLVKRAELNNAGKNLSKDFKQAVKTAISNIARFHRAQKTDNRTVTINKGIKCFLETRPIENIGVYVPGGTAPLVSTVLMVCVPAGIAKVKNITICSPPEKNGDINESILYAAKACQIDNVLKIGGAQSIAALAYGTETIRKVAKIFGPGNQYVTAAKMLVSIDPDGAAIDMPAGPSEVLIIADKQARTDYVASDLLSQAEHGKDSFVVLVATSMVFANSVIGEMKKQLKSLKRKEIIKAVIRNNFFIVLTDNISQGVAFSNEFAPEHLILNVKNPNRYVSRINNVGSVFMGQYSPESAGDYASGTNHVLPTSGYAKSISGLSLSSFQKTISFQELDRSEITRLNKTIAVLAETEGLDAHKNAANIRAGSITR